MAALAGYEPNLCIHSVGRGITPGHRHRVVPKCAGVLQHALEAMAQGIAEETRHLRGQVDEAGRMHCQPPRSRRRAPPEPDNRTVVAGRQAQ
jgi:hypothetical protein